MRAYAMQYSIGSGANMVPSVCSFLSSCCHSPKDYDYLLRKDKACLGDCSDPSMSS